MTGPGRSPSSPWVQSAQGRTSQPFHTGLSPSQTTMQTSSERHSPNYFGITVEHSSNSPTSNSGAHTQKNWASFQSSLPSPKLQLYAQQPVSEGLSTILRSESEVDKGRRESTLQSFSTNGDSPAKRTWSRTSHAPTTGGLANHRMQPSPSEYSIKSGENPGAASRGEFPPSPSHFDIPQEDLTDVLVFQSIDDGSSISSRWITAERCAELIKSKSQEILLLDVRPYAHFSQSNITSSLNLCIPTTLLKRRSFDTQKLENTFTSDDDKRNFARWRECTMIIVYDSATTDAKDAVPLMHVISKFQAENWEGEGLILQGGFKAFSSQFPQLVRRPQAQTAGLSPKKKRSPMSIDLNSVAPVVGGCALPASSSAANPFFGNIRQNMDLMGGVGQIPLKLPDGLTETQRQELPLWLREASDVKDQGHLVSEKFLDLEKKELERMQQALTYEGDAASTGGATKKYRVAGIEKGTKNRYNDIYPFDHSRVRLEGIPSGGCDYVNANHIQAEFSNRRYIATQAPVPDTFNDFWRVVWEQDVRLLVSLTAEVERGQTKCHPYWKSGDYGPFKVKAYSERFINVDTKDRSIDPTAKFPLGSSQSSQQASKSDESNENPVIIVRHFSLYHTAFPFQPLRDITQLQYPYWPDFGTTSQPAHLLNLIEQCNKVIRSTSPSNFGNQDAEPKGQRPILVHCSAGCGRTGTFCTVDSVLDMLKRQRMKTADPNMEGLQNPSLDLIVKTVEDFRTQRPSMVQNLGQFVLCYESVLEWLTMFTDLPTELVQLILRSCDTATYLQLAQSCRSLYEIATKDRKLTLHQLLQTPGHTDALDLLSTEELVQLLRKRSHQELFGTEHYTDRKLITDFQGKKLNVRASSLEAPILRNRALLAFQGDETVYFVDIRAGTVSLRRRLESPAKRFGTIEVLHTAFNSSGAYVLHRFQPFLDSRLDPTHPFVKQALQSYPQGNIFLAYYSFDPTAKGVRLYSFHDESGYDPIALAVHRSSYDSYSLTEITDTRTSDAALVGKGPTTKLTFNDRGLQLLHHYRAQPLFSSFQKLHSITATPEPRVHDNTCVVEYSPSLMLQFAIGIPFFATHRNGVESNVPGTCHWQYLSVGIATHRVEHWTVACLLKSQSNPSVFRCDHVMNLDRGRRFDDWTVVAQLGGYQESNTTQGALIAASPLGTRVAIASWKTVTVWALEPTMIVDENLDYYPDSWINSAGLTELRSAAIQLDAVCSQLKFAENEHELVAVTDRGLMLLDIRPSGRGVEVVERLDIF
ncbi:Tyrosine-protein phosphatase 1 [Penicillium rolfsii]|nr:Tyrosine-protein phosphatase 1 [Penicillium rolfsii]